MVTSLRFCFGGSAIAVLILSAALFTPDEAGAQLFKRKKTQSVTPLAPGQYEWYPERSPVGPLLVVVSIDDQMAYVYRNAVQIGRSTVSTGAEGHDTPTGVFTILEKHKEHESSIYKGAQMPNMQRLTWSGIAMHAGKLPGYPASHGCVRLPLEFSEKLFSITDKGGTVVITKKAAKPAYSAKTASILLATKVEPGSRLSAEMVGKTVWEPERSPSGPVNLLFSGRDRTIYIYRNGILIGQTPVALEDPEKPIHAGVFLMLEGVERGVNQVVPGKPMRPWAVLSLEQGAPADAGEDIRRRLRVPPDIGRKAYDLITPGSILLTTPEGVSSQTSSARDFTIMTPQGH